jgi:tetratricopeptide (TPR) repeat protein
MKLSKISFILFLVTFGTAKEPIYAQNIEIQKQFSEAQKVYEEGKYDETIVGFRNIQETGWLSDDLFSNLGSSYLKKGDLANAILNYEKALLINPQNEAAQQNLSLAREQIESPVSIIPDFILITIYRDFINLMSSRGWLVLHIICLAVFSLLLAIVWFELKWGQISESFSTWKYSYLIIFVFFLFSCLALLISFQRGQQIKYSGFGIVMNKEIVLKSGPDDRSTIISNVPQGSKVAVLSQLNDWYKVELQDKDLGWIQASVIEMIAIP